MQLALFSVVPGVIFGVYAANGAEVIQNGFFYGYNTWTWVAILCQALGGLIVAMVVKYLSRLMVDMQITS